MDDINSCIEIMEAYRNGASIQYKSKTLNTEWRDIVTPRWNFFDYYYRIKPEPEVNLEELVGTVVVNKNSLDRHLILGYNSDEETVLVNDCYISYAGLTTCYMHTNGYKI